MSKPVTKFTNTNVRQILSECEEALRPIAEKYGLTLDQKGKSYRRDALPVMYQFLVRETDEEGNEMSSEGKEFQRRAPWLGLEASDLNREFTSRGRKYRITGLNPRGRKYPILAEEVRTGKKYKFPVEVVKAGLEKAA